MKYEVKSIEEYLDQLTDDRKEVVNKLRTIVCENLPVDFQETISYNMIGFVVPKNIYSKGYHVDPSIPLPFLNIASQKNHIAIYHMGLYLFPDILDWFKNEYAKRVKTKLDMGKGCIRFKNLNNIPYDLIKELCQKISVDDYVKKYEQAILR